MKNGLIVRVLPALLLAAAPAGALAGPISKSVESYPVESRQPREAPVTFTSSAAFSACIQSVVEGVIRSTVATGGEMGPSSGAVACTNGPRGLAGLPVLAAMWLEFPALDATGWFRTDGGNQNSREPVESSNKEIELLPSVVTFFCNPYKLAMCGPPEGDELTFTSDSLSKIDLGVMGWLSDDVRVAVFSTLSTLAFTEEFMTHDRADLVGDALTHKFAFLLSVSPARNFFLGAAGGAQMVEAPRSYTFEFLLEARLKF